MQITVDISMYPLEENFVDPINSFLDRIKTHLDLIVEVGEMSTRVTGELDLIMQILSAELKQSFIESPNSVFVTKIVHTACKA